MKPQTQPVYFDRKHADAAFLSCLLQGILSVSPAWYMIFDADSRCLCHNLAPAVRDRLSARLHAELPACRAARIHSFFLSDDTAGSFFVQAKQLCSPLNQNYTLFCLTRSGLRPVYTKYGLTAMTQIQAKEHLHLKFYGSSEYLAASFPPLPPADPRGGDRTPVLITGETGSGKDQLACLFYLQNCHSEKPLYIANCTNLNEKSWQFLTASSRSPLMDNGNTIYFANLGALSEDRQKSLLTFITDSGLSSRNRLLFSCGRRFQSGLPHVAMEYANMLGCSVLPIPALREQPDRLSSLADCCFSALAKTQNRTALKLSEDALPVIFSYDWPYNRTQLERVLKAALQHAAGPVISADDMKEALLQERAFSENAATGGKNMLLGQLASQIGPAQKLSEITRDIIRVVLADCGGNQSLAAKRLGISRTTLWRYLNQ